MRDAENAEAEGILIARELVQRVRSMAAGVRVVGSGVQAVLL